MSRTFLYSKIWLNPWSTEHIENSSLWNIHAYSYISLENISVIHVSMYECVLFFLLCFSMKHRDFSVKSKPIISLFKQWKYDFWIFIVLDYFFLPYFIISRQNVLPKGFNVLVLYYVGICSLFQTFSYETFIAVLKPGLYLWPASTITNWMEKCIHI